MKHNWIKKLYCFILVAFLMVSLVPATVYAAPDTEEKEEVVFPEDAIYLSTVEDLLALAENCIDDDWSVGKTIVLQNDIDLSGVDFFGIPTFGGTFYGDGHKILGWTVEYKRSVVGFFRYTQSKAVVQDLHIDGNIHPKGSASIVGTIAGCNGGTIKNCSFTGEVSGKEIIGGIAGLNKTSSLIENCTVNGKVYGNHYIGGIAGENKGVIRQCTNLAEINAEVDHNSLGMSLEVDLNSLGSKETIDTATNIGGIAGTSTGVIRECENHANVGYKKMGHNVGGIVGSQNGYVVDCINYGKVEGSDGVGGIVGQFMPNIVLEFGPDPVKTMTNKMNSMKNSMNEMKSSIGELEFDLSDGSIDMSAEMNDLKDALESLDSWDRPEIGEFDPDRLDSLKNDFSNSFDKIYDESAEISNITDSFEVASKMENMMSEMEGMMSSMDSMNLSTEISIEDVSRYDKESDTIGKVAGCINYGEIAGENGVAGIAGNCDSEMLMSKDDVDVQGEESMNISGSIRLVLRDCKNFGTISANKEYVGGIAGQMVQGAILDCYNIGHMDALNAEYVGGIAGNCDTYISGCISKNIIAGADYVGGITGCGVEVLNCYAFVDIAAGTEYVGSIIGGMEELPSADSSLVSNNYYCYVGMDRGGIDGINYKGATARISFEDFVLLENLNDMFKTVEVRFVVEGQDDIVLTVDLGRDVELEDVPVVKVSDSDRYDWEYVKPVTSETLAMDEVEEIYYLSEERLSHIYFNQTYEAIIDAKHMVSEGTNKTADGHTIVLAVGAFDQTTTVTLTDVLKQNPEVNGAAVIENWQVSISNIGVEKLHYRIPEGVDAEHLVLYVRDHEGNWSKREFSVEGSFMIFEFTDSNFGFALAETSGNGFFIGIIAAVVVVIIIAVLISKKRKQRVVKKVNKE